MQITAVSQAVKLLIIEDNLADINLVNELLKVSGLNYTLVQRETLSQALTYLSDSPVDLVLLDLSLPDSLGLQTFIRLHTLVPEVAVVILTGLEDVGVATEAMRAGAQDYIIKNHLKSEDLIKSISFAIERNRLLWKQMERKDELEKQVSLLEEALSEHPGSDKLRTILESLAESSRRLMLRDDLQMKQLQDYSGAIEVLKSQVSSMREDVDNLVHIVQIGNGAPPIGSRLAVLEASVSYIKEWIDEQKQDSKEVGRLRKSTRNAIITGIISIASALIGFLTKWWFDK